MRASVRFRVLHPAKISFSVLVWTPFALLMGTSSAQSELPTVSEILSEVGEGAIEVKHHDDVIQGELVVSTLAEVSDRELAVNAACLVTRSPSEVLAPFLADRPAGSGSDIEIISRIEDPKVEAALATLELGDDAEAEAKRYAGAQPGFELNLSIEEYALFAAVDDGDPELVAKVEAILRDALGDRIAGYAHSGLDGAKGYARGDGKVSRPAQELHRSFEGSGSLAKVFPVFSKIWSDYPEPAVEADSEAWFWSRLNVDGRPAFMLTHRIDAIAPDRGIVARRGFYFSHFFDAGFEIAGVAATVEGNLFFFVRRVWVDHWSGMSSVKRKLGHTMLAGKLRDAIETNGICR